MSKLLEMWKWKLIITGILTLYFALPLFYGNKPDSDTIIILSIIPVLIWLSLTYSFHKYGERIKKEIEESD
jgi:hypothetical protein